MVRAFGVAVILLGVTIVIWGFRTKKFEAEGILIFLSDDSGQLPRWFGLFSCSLVGSAFIAAGVFILLGPR